MEGERSTKEQHPIQLFLKNTYSRVYLQSHNGRAPVITKDKNSSPFKVKMLMPEAFYIPPFKLQNSLTRTIKTHVLSLDLISLTDCTGKIMSSIINLTWANSITFTPYKFKPLRVTIQLNILLSMQDQVNWFIVMLATYLLWIFYHYLWMTLSSLT